MVDAALPGDILAKEDGLGVAEHQVVQCAVELHGHVPGPVVLRQAAPEGGRTLLGGRRLLGDGGDGLGPVGRQGRDHVLGGLDARPGLRLAAEGLHPGAEVCVPPEDLVRGHPAPRDQLAGGADERVHGLDRVDLVFAAVQLLDIRAGVPEQADHAEVEDRGAAGPADELDGRRRAVHGVGEVQAVPVEVLDARVGLEAAGHPALGRADADPDPVVLADEEHGAGEVLVVAEGGGVEGRARGGVVGRGVAEGAHRDRVVRDRALLAQRLEAVDEEGRADGLGEVRGDGRGLRWDPQGRRAEDLVAAARDGLVCGGDHAQEHVEQGVVPGTCQATHEEGPGPVVEEGGVGRAQGSGDGRVALVARRPDGVEALLPRLEGPGLHVEGAARQHASKTRRASLAVAWLPARTGESRSPRRGDGVRAATLDWNLDSTIPARLTAMAGPPCSGRPAVSRRSRGCDRPCAAEGRSRRASALETDGGRAGGGRPADPPRPSEHLGIQRPPGGPRGLGDGGDQVEVAAAIRDVRRLEERRGGVLRAPSQGQQGYDLLLGIPALLGGRARLEARRAPSTGSPAS